MMEIWEPWNLSILLVQLVNNLCWPLVWLLQLKDHHNVTAVEVSWFWVDFVYLFVCNWNGVCEEARTIPNAKSVSFSDLPGIIHGRQVLDAYFKSSHRLFRHAMWDMAQGRCLAQPKLKFCTVLGSMMPNWLQFSFINLIQNWQFMAKNGFKLDINLYLVHGGNFDSLAVWASICRWDAIDLTVVLMPWTEIVKIISASAR